MTTSQILLTKTGNHAKFEFKHPDKLSNPEKIDDFVHIDVAYSGLNFADVMMKLGLYPDAPALPYIPGYEVSGIVKAVGGSSTFQVGDHVFAGTAFGGYQSEIILPSWQVRKIPKGVTLEEGAALMVSLITAYTSFCHLARVKRTDRVLIDCGSGALGGTSFSLLKNLGLSDMTGLTRSPEKLSIINDHGVNGLLTSEYNKSHELYDVILNTRGGKSIPSDYQRLTPTGRLIMLGASSMVSSGKKNLLHVISEFLGMKKFSPIDLMNDNKAVMGLNALRLFDHQDILSEALDYFDENPFAGARVDRIFKAEEIEQALDYLGSGRSRGKVLLKW